MSVGMPMEKTICVTHINHCHLPRSTTHLGIVLWIRELPNCAMFTITLTESLEVADCWSRVGILPPLLYPFVSWDNSSSRPSASVVTSSQLTTLLHCQLLSICCHLKWATAASSLQIYATYINHKSPSHVYFPPWISAVHKEHMQLKVWPYVHIDNNWTAGGHWL